MSDLLNLGSHDSRILGDDRFIEKVFSNRITLNKPDLDDIISHVCKNSGVREKELSSPSRKRILSKLRGIIGWLARDLGVAHLSEVATRFNRDLTTISRAVNKVEEQQSYSQELQELRNKLT